MAAEAMEPEVPSSSGPRRSPRLDQYRRTWFFLRRNTLAMFGIGVIMFLVLIGIYAATTSVPWNVMPQCFGTNNQVVTFQESGLPAGTQWSVTIANVSTESSSGSSISFSLGSGPIYQYTISNVTGYTAAPSHGSFPVAGTPLTGNKAIRIAFTTGGAASTDGGAPSASFTPSASSVLGCTVCTYPVGTPSPGPNCYQTPTGSPSVIAPTVGVSGLGPLPMGAMTQTPGQSYFFNLYNGLLRGTDYSLLVSISIVGVGATLGLFIGAVAGFWGGVVDEALMRLVDIFLSIPQILFVIVVIAVVTTDYVTIFGLSGLDTRVFLLITAFMVTWWPFYARIVRGQVLVVREQKYVEAARASGASKGRIVMKHVIPNSTYPVLIQMSLDVGTIPLLIGFLVFLGFLIWPTPYFPEWGTISALGTLDVVQGFLGLCATGATCSIPWWQLFFPGLAVFLFAISVNFVSDGLRDALDPRLRR
ncbi:MAG: ABC transporter permease [Thermoplasmata archaeon]|jgi:peptide/nickel transport system permease protein